MRIEPFDFASAPADLAESVFGIVVDEARELAPEDPVPTLDEHVETMVTMPSWRHLAYVVAWEGDDPVGLAHAQWETTESNVDLGGFGVSVRPAQRRRGVGSALAGAALEVLAAAGRTSIHAGSWDGAPGGPFLTSLGMTPKLRERKSRCYVKDIDVEMLRRWVDGAAAREKGYSLITWDGSAPEEHAERFVRIVHIMNTAPLDDFEREDDAFTVEMLRDGDRAAEEKGLMRFVAVVRHDESGEFAGFTTLAIDRRHPGHAQQWGTSTDPAHRNQGIGRWLKAANALRVLAAHPDVEYVDTWNAGSNAPMLAINEAMGFRPIRCWDNYQAPRSVIEARLSARS